VLLEVLDIEAAFINALLEEEVYIEIPELYYEYCEARGIEPPPPSYKYLQAHDGPIWIGASKWRELAWVKRFQCIITRKEFGMVQECKTDPCLFVKHDANGILVLWVVTSKPTKNRLSGYQK
jgi:hypothetical protein